jgi:hypothetical protein
MSHMLKKILLTLCLTSSLFALEYDGKSDLNDFYSTYRKDSASSSDPMTFIQKVMADIKPDVMREEKSDAPIAVIAYQKDDEILFKNVLIQSFDKEGLNFLGYKMNDISKASLEIFWTKPSYGQIRMIGEITAIGKDQLSTDLMNKTGGINPKLASLNAYQFKPTKMVADFIVNEEDGIKHHVVQYTFNEDTTWTQTNDLATYK